MSNLPDIMLVFCLFEVSLVSSQREGSFSHTFYPFISYFPVIFFPSSVFFYIHHTFFLRNIEDFPSECGETCACGRCGVPGRRGELGRGLCHGGHPRGLHQPQVCLYVG
jgi:hypothetical protein